MIQQRGMPRSRFSNVAILLRLLSAMVASCIVFTSSAHSDEPKSKAAAAPKPQGKANRLAKETSPYLLLHAHNPVDWYPWGPEAFAKAKAEKKPIFLSIGYSSCYWCHVMERESFMDPVIAKALNDGFVCVKVDREERPDVDQVYMIALQAFSGSGGWPMSMFLMPDGRPFYGGTYFPPNDREGMLGFSSLIKAVLQAYREKPDLIERDATQLSEVVRRVSARSSARKTSLSRGLAASGRAALAEQYDPENGGFGFDPARPKRPKFPEPANLVYLLDQHHRFFTDDDKAADAPLAMVSKTLDRMARGGIRDHLAGGFHRYSTIRDWSVPHFEKMLYDNAQLAQAYLQAFEQTKSPQSRIEAEATLAFLQRSMTSPEGGFYSSLDAETEGEEGASYVWTPDQVKQAVGASEYPLFARVYGLDRPANFEGGRFVLLEPTPRAEAAKALGLSEVALEARLVLLRAKLLAARERRPSPLLDDKVLTSWNGLTIGAFADGYRILKNPEYRKSAERGADFVLAKLKTSEGRLLRAYRLGVAKLPAYLEDYAFLADGLLRLHAATGDPRRLDQARKLIDRMILDFSDTKEGGFFYTADDHESLIARTKDPFDNAIPGANSLAVRSLVRLAVLTKETTYLDHARRALESFSGTFLSNPAGCPLLLTALEEYLDARETLGHAPAVGAIAGLPAPVSGGVVKGVVKVEPVESPGATVVDLKLTLDIASGFHLYANPSGVEDLPPTTVELEAGTEFDVVSTRYPAGEGKTLPSLGTAKVSLYEKSTTIVVRLKSKEGASPGDSTVRLKVRYQACNDKACLAPASLTVSTPLTIKPR